MIAAVAVVIPIHDEEATLAPCLASVLAACDAVPRSVRTCIVPTLDACTDRSPEIAEALLGIRGAPLHVRFRNVGRARHAGVAHALAQCGKVPRSTIWIATTDADSLVPPSWLIAQLALASDGADAVAGTIRVDDWRGHSDVHARAFERFYAPAGCSDSHDHVHGTNLGVRADAYAMVGGFPHVETGEDHALWNALRRSGRTLVSTRRLVVSTSARLRGRAPRGFADFLARFESNVV